MGSAGASGSVPLFPADYLTWQSSYGSATNYGSSSTSTGEAASRSYHGRCGVASPRADASVPSSSYESPPSHREEEHAAELAAQARAGNVLPRRESATQRPAKKGSLNWLTLTFQDSKLEALYADYFVDSVLRTDR